MRNDLIEAFAQGKTTKQLITEGVAAPKTVYYYHSLYGQIKEAVRSEEFVNEVVRLLLKLRVKIR